MRALARVALVLLALSPLSCAVGGGVAVQHPMPAARSGLSPELRVFYDALVDYGEWTTIEPFGYVFRPDVSFIGWQPYEYGFWVPSDSWGWVWISSEPFGWATYHYGSWTWDRFEGWVWIPGLDWGPAWVDWQVADDYVGWAPRVARAPAGGVANADAWRYIPVAQMTSTAITGQLLKRSQLGPRAERLESIQNFAATNGVTFNRGPSFEMVEKQVGRLALVRIDEIATGPGAPRDSGAATPLTPSVEATRRAAEEAARDAKRIAESGAPAPREVPIIRYLRERPDRGLPGKPLPAPGRRRAPADSTRR
jgi:hypothetical protein